MEDTDNELYGIWKDRKDIKNVEDYVRKMRKSVFTVSIENNY